MKISSVNVIITKEDLFGILKEVIDEFLGDFGLTIEGVEITKHINIKGNYLNKINIHFLACIDIYEVKNNMLKLKISDMKIGKFKVFNFLSNFALKKILNQFLEKGIFFDNGYVIVDLNKIITDIPATNFNIISITVNNYLKLELENINVSLSEINNLINKKDTSKENDFKEDNAESKDEKDSNEEEIIKKEDSYTEFRNDVLNNVPDKYSDIMNYVILLPDIIALLVRLFKDNRVSYKIKTELALILTYLFSPIDVLFDFIPIVGQVDDVAVAFIGLNKILNDIPQNVVLENWNGKDNIIETTRKGAYYITNFIGVHNLSKILNYITPKNKVRKNRKKENLIKKCYKVKQNKNFNQKELENDSKKEIIKKNKNDVKINYKRDKKQNRLFNILKICKKPFN